MRAIMLALALLCLAFTPAHAGIFGPRGALGDIQSHSILAKARRDLGRNPTGWSRQWCGRQMAMWAGGGSNLAADWRHAGRPSSPRPGAIGVMPHHVGVVESVGPGYVILISGNHSGRPGARVVGRGKYPISRFIAFRAL